MRRVTKHSASNDEISSLKTGDYHEHFADRHPAPQAGAREVQERQVNIIKTSDGGIPDMTGLGQLGSTARNHEVEVMAVLTQDDAGLYAVYIGIVKQSVDKKRSAKRIAAGGSKLRYERAKFFFTDLQEKEYRR